MNNSFLAVGDEHLEKMMLNESALKQDLYDYYEQAVNKAIELKVKYFISCGDLFDTNKPLAFSIEFVANLNNKLKEHNVTPLAIAGDHSKSIEGTTWEDICGFQPICNEPTFVGVDYDDNPAIVKSILNTQLLQKGDRVQFIFLHGQVPELFGYCEEKKTLDLNWEELSKNFPTLKGIILSDIHSGPYKHLNNGCFLGYTGMTGVTKLDEICEKKYIHWDGNKLNFVVHPLLRNFHEFILIEESLEEISRDKADFEAKEIAEIQESIKTTGRKPVYIIRYRKSLFNKLTELVFLHDHAIVRSTLLKEDKVTEDNINIRSEISDTSSLSEVFKATLVESNTYNEEIYDIGINLISSLESGNTKDILNNFKEKYIK